MICLQVTNYTTQASANFDVAKRKSRIYVSGMNQLQAVGFAPEPPQDEVKRAHEAAQKLLETLKNVRRAFDHRRMKQLDTEIANAWMISSEIEQRLAKIRRY